MDSVLPNSERKRPLFIQEFLLRDIVNFHYPLRKVLIDSYAGGEFPLWNPYIFLGQPLLANPNYLAFYPTNLFHLFLPFDYAFKLHFIIHPLLGGLGCYFPQRRLGRVEFLYRPRSFYAGLSVTSVSLLLGVAALFRHLCRRSLRDGEAG